MNFETMKEQAGRECWLWRGKINGGYGVLRVDGREKRAHRHMWELVNGPIPEGMHVLHTCDESRCINPDHLRLGTNEENAREYRERGYNAIQAIPEELQARLLKEYRPGDRGRGMKALAARYGIDRNTVRKYLRRAGAARGGKL